ncbi:MAG: universal stress protein [Cyanobacteria bacterium J06642_2]
MFRRILVALDGTPVDRAVFTKAANLAKAMNAYFMILHILSVEDEGSPGSTLGMTASEGQPSKTQLMSVYDEINWESYRREWHQFEQESFKKFSLYSDRANAMGIKTEFTQVPGNPGQLIEKIAQNWDADLIVMGSRGHTGLRELVLGSVSNYVMHHAMSSVLIID